MSALTASSAALLGFALAAAPAAPPRFRDVARSAGAAIRHHPAVFDHRLDHIMPMVSAGASGGAVGDYDGDGWLDIFVTDSGAGTSCHLLRNNGDLTFTDVTAEAGLSHVNDEGGVATMALFFDANGDGYEDLFVARLGTPKLFLNDGRGHFKDVSAEAGFTRPLNALSAVAFDFDRDGNVDLYLGGYFPDVDLFRLRDAEAAHVLHESWEDARNGGSKLFYRNLGNGHFQEMTREVGLEDSGWTMAIGTGDLDGDGWPDVYVANDYGPDKVFRNTGKGRFEDVSLRAIGKDTKKGMNADLADYDNDGDLDIYVTNVTEAFLHECNMLWRNQGNGTFTDVAEETGTCDTGWGWGGKFFDYDNDGYQDLYVANGFFTGRSGGDYLDILLPRLWDSGENPSNPAVWPPTGGRGIASMERNVLFHNLAGRSFERTEGSGADLPSDSRAVLLGDFDNDGRVDLFVTNVGADSFLLLNETATANHWVEMELRNSGRNTDALGARITVRAGTLTMMREVNAGNGASGGSMLRQHFGLAGFATIDQLDVRWPDGALETWKGVPADRLLRIRRGGRPEPLPVRAPAKPRTAGERPRRPAGRAPPALAARRARTPSVRSAPAREARAKTFQAQVAAARADRSGAPARSEEKPAGSPGFVDVTESAGVAHLHHEPSVDEKLKNLGPWFGALGAGAAVGDFDNDGLEDIYVTDSRAGYPNALYKNMGGFHFVEVARQAGVADVNDAKNFSTTALFLDCDNDGYKDLLVVRFGTSKLFHNKGNGSFEDISDRLHVNGIRNPVAAVALDYDRDGKLDIYLGSYFPDLDLTNLKTTRILHDSWETARQGGTNVLLHNEGNCTFRDVTAESGLGDTGWSLALGVADVDRDGWPDVYVANDFGPDKLYRNLGNGRFQDISATSIGVDTKKGMNAEWGDYDNDGWMDVYVTNITEQFLRECNMLHRNNGDLTFTDVAEASGVCDTGWGWGGKFLDYDNDGWLDLYVANGFISGGKKDYIDILMPIILDSDVDLSNTVNWPPIGDMSFSGYERKKLFHNVRGRFFDEVGRQQGVDNDRDGRGILIADFDNDGAQDIYLLNSRQRAIMYRNVAGAKNSWIELSLAGTRSNRDAIGTKVTFHRGGQLQYREVNAGNGFEGQSSPVVHAGFGDATVVDRIRVEWPSGLSQEFANVKTRTRYRLVEGGQLTPIGAGVAGGQR